MSPRSPGPDDRRLAAAAVALQMVAAGAACGDPYWDDDATARAQQVCGYCCVVVQLVCLNFRLDPIQLRVCKQTLL